jgi:hypothetical protein
MEANKKGFKGVWLCAAIYESSELSAVEKLLLAEIDALTTDTDACYATNAVMGLVVFHGRCAR